MSNQNTLIKSKPSFDTLATRGKIGIVVPATNTVVQPEMELMLADRIRMNCSG